MNYEAFLKGSFPFPLSSQTPESQESMLAHAVMEMITVPNNHSYLAMQNTMWYSIVIDIYQTA